jgi:hypothetical protein
MTTENMQVITPRRSTRKRTQIVELQVGIYAAGHII